MKLAILQNDEVQGPNQARRGIHRKNPNSPRSQVRAKSPNSLKKQVRVKNPKLPYKGIVADLKPELSKGRQGVTHQAHRPSKKQSTG